jgi:magnesium chelatase family protein
VRTLLDAVDTVLAQPRPPGCAAPPPSRPEAAGSDLADVRGQLLARRALEIAAAGGHNLLLVGAPGSGKTMLARRLPGILPPLTEEEAIEATAIHSAWGAPVSGLLRERPFRNPHHTVSAAALVGGGSLPRPGEVSLAHHGVLFLDELPQFPAHALDALRQPLEDRVVTVCRARRALRFPASFQLVAAMNPCRCGRRGDPLGGCGCSDESVRAYQARISGPLLDRIDLHVEVPLLRAGDLEGSAGEPSAAVARRVCAARARQLARGATNAALPAPRLRAAAGLDPDAQKLLSSTIDRFHLSGRAHDRLLRVARTIADLDQAEGVLSSHLAEAVQFRASIRF